MKGARSIKAVKGINYRGSVPSHKCGDMVEYESLLERDYINLLEFDSKVEYFESQPMKIPYMYKGKRHDYFPDFKIITHENKIKLIEVKPKRFLNLEKNMIKFEVGKQYCKVRNWEYHIFTEEEIRKGYLQDNLRKLNSVNFDRIRSALKEQILQKVKEMGPIEIDVVVNKFPQFDRNELYEHIYYLIYFHQLYTDLINKNLGGNSIIKINKIG